MTVYDDSIISAVQEQEPALVLVPLAPQQELLRVLERRRAPVLPAVERPQAQAPELLPEQRLVAPSPVRERVPGLPGRVPGLRGRELP
ncbi:MAG: hypothetical protein ABTR07_13395 [Candidatus Competibacter denitrificans]